MSEQPRRPSTTMTADAPQTVFVNTPRREPTNEELGLAPASSAPAPATARRRRRRRVGRRFGAAALAVMAVAGIAYALSPEHTSNRSWTEAGITAVQMDLAEGDVDITQSGDDQVHLSEDLAWRGGDFTTAVTKNGSTLVIGTGHAPIRFGFNWHDRLHYKLALPKGTALTYHQSAGDSTLSGSFGAVTITSGAGDVKASGLSASALAITTTAGDVTLAQLTAPTTSVSQTAGDLRLTYAAAPEQLTVKTTAGDMDVTLPGSSSYTVTQHHTGGSVAVTVPQDSTGQHRVGVETTAGDVKIHP